MFTSNESGKLISIQGASEKCEVRDTAAILVTKIISLFLQAIARKVETLMKV